MTKGSGVKSHDEMNPPSHWEGESGTCESLPNFCRDFPLPHIHAQQADLVKLQARVAELEAAVAQLQAQTSAAQVRDEIVGKIIAMINECYAAQDGGFHPIWSEHAIALSRALEVVRGAGWTL